MLRRRACAIYIYTLFSSVQRFLLQIADGDAALFMPYAGVAAHFCVHNHRWPRRRCCLDIGHASRGFALTAVDLRMRRG